MDVIIFDGIRPVLDVLIHIASYDEETWIKLYLYDEFHSYARTDIGINKCIQSFWKTHSLELTTYENKRNKQRIIYASSYFWKRADSEGVEKVKTIFGKPHSFYDEPSVINVYSDMCWHKNGVLHRDNKYARSYLCGW